MKILIVLSFLWSSTVIWAQVPPPPPPPARKSMKTPPPPPPGSPHRAVRAKKSPIKPMAEENLPPIEPLIENPLEFYKMEKAKSKKIKKIKKRKKKKVTKKKTKKKIKKRKPSAVAKSFKKGRTLKFKKNCTMHSKPSFQSVKAGRVRAGKKLWIDPHNSEWRKAYKKSGPVFIHSSCF